MRGPRTSHSGRSGARPACPKARLVIDRSKFPTADDEYTPAQRRIVDAHLAEGLADIKAGRVSKVFSSAEEFIADLHKAVRKRTPRPKTKRLAK